MIALDIATEGDGWTALGDAAPLARAAIGAALAVAGADGLVAIDLLLTDDAGMHALNRTFRGQDKPTNVLSFPAPPGAAARGPRHLGEIALAFGTVAREAAAERKPLADHVSHLLVHGALHLLGLDHGSEGEAAAMEALEVEALASLGIADPYRDAA